MNISEEILSYGLSLETFAKLKKFAGVLVDWNAKMNLVSKNSMNDLWARHILDSLQLLSYLPNCVNTIVDIGSGAGFPAVVLAVAMAEKMPQTKLVLVESITKKTVYLNDVVQKLGLKNVQIINSRVENTVFKDVDVITARAVAALDVLLSYQDKIGSDKTFGLYLKGKSYGQEIENALKNWNFACDVASNKYNDDGVVLKISDVRRKK